MATSDDTPGQGGYNAGGSAGGGGLSGSGSAGGGGLSGSGAGGSTSGSGLSGSGSGTSGSGLSGSGSTGGSGLSGSGSGSGSGSTSGSGLSGSGTGGMSGTGAGGTTGGSGLSATGGGGADDFDLYDTGYRRHYEASPATATTGGYDQARRGYALGHRAAARPNYAGRRYEEVEVDLRTEYGEDKETPFEAVRDYARHAFEWKAVVGALAVAVGGWWAGRKLYDVFSEMGTAEDEDCRTYYESHPARTTVTYDQARTGYTLGYAASRNPDYAGRGFDDVETELRGGFTGSRVATYDTVRDFTRRGYERGTGGTGGTGGFGGTSTGGGTTL